MHWLSNIVFSINQKNWSAAAIINLRGPEILREGWVILIDGVYLSGSRTAKRFQNMTDPPGIASKLVNLIEYS